MNYCYDIDQRIVEQSKVARILVKSSVVKSAFVDYKNSEIIIIVRDSWVEDSLNEMKKLLPFWLNHIHYSKDSSIEYSTSCTRVDRIRILKMEGSPLRLKLINQSLEKIL